MKWLSISSNAVLSGTVCISNSASAPRPLQKMDLFVDGKFFQTMTNLAPQPGNVLSAAIEGYPVSYTVPTDATLGSIVTGLVQCINIPWLTNITKVQAFTHGDRIELRSISTNFLADPFYYVDRLATNGTNFSYRVSYLPFPERPQFNSLAMDPAAGYRMQIETMPGVPCVVLASTDLQDWVPIATNVDGGTNVSSIPEVQITLAAFFALLLLIPGHGFHSLQTAPASAFTFKRRRPCPTSFRLPVTFSTGHPFRRTFRRFHGPAAARLHQFFRAFLSR